MPLQEEPSGRTLASAIETVSGADYRWIADTPHFRFNWKKESANEVYKMFLVDEDEILDLVSLTDGPEEYRIHLDLIETSEEHRGEKKTISNIAGCLIAFACKLAFERRYDGFVSLQPKTKLIDLYQERYHFRQYGHYLGVEQELARKLIEEYLYDETEDAT
ncbi:hypothetical protein LEM8419_01970 [Neolewinella maritima]|uniref:GNAT family N-acetyltransferase n=1 Tax=Neolewinella maritima TaxID=1383882 RepID=A0ABN8F270_9BACT|nr:hypothetical protein [Neolewinella maritima]CAH1000958.1 hypothetical protein LEM8419_01970 [Neolewinella maritima]